MNLFNALSLLSFVGVLILAYFVKKIRDEYESRMDKVRAVLNRIYFELNVQKMVESESLQSLEGMAEIGKKVFNMLKGKFGMGDINTYSEMKARVEKMEIDEEEKEAIIRFLDNMIMLEYAPKNINKSKKEEIRDSILRVFRMVSALQRA